MTRGRVAAIATLARLEPALSADGSFVTLPCPACGTGRATIDENSATCTNRCAPRAINGPVDLVIAAAAPSAPSNSVDAPLGDVRVVTLAEFIAVDEPGADPLVGDADANLIPEGGLVMVYGDGGAGKTTLTVDLGMHLAAGNAWLGTAIRRPARVLLIENEGPRALFRKKLGRKDAGWQGSPVEDRITVVDEPWAKFRFDSVEGRAALASVIRERRPQRP